MSKPPIPGMPVPGMSRERPSGQPIEMPAGQPPGAALPGDLPLGPEGIPGDMGSGGGKIRGLAEVGDLGVFVHRPADPVADEAADDGEAGLLDRLLDGR